MTCIKSSNEGFDNEEVILGSEEVLRVAREALASDPDSSKLEILEEMIKTRRLPAHELIESYAATKDIINSLEEVYDRYV